MGPEDSSPGFLGLGSPQGWVFWSLGGRLLTPRAFLGAEAGLVSGHSSPTQSDRLRLALRLGLPW